MIHAARALILVASQAMAGLAIGQAFTAPPMTLPDPAGVSGNINARYPLAKARATISRAIKEDAVTELPMSAEVNINQRVNGDVVVIVAPKKGAK